MRERPLLSKGVCRLHHIPKSSLAQKGGVPWTGSSPRPTLRTCFYLHRCGPTSWSLAGSPWRCLGRPKPAPARTHAWNTAGGGPRSPSPRPPSSAPEIIMVNVPAPELGVSGPHNPHSVLHLDPRTPRRFGGALTGDSDAFSCAGSRQLCLPQCGAAPVCNCNVALVTLVHTLQCACACVCARASFGARPRSRGGVLGQHRSALADSASRECKTPRSTRAPALGVTPLLLSAALVGLEWSVTLHFPDD